MSAVMNGDRSALAPLVERHHSGLLGYLYRMVQGDRALADDLVQETYIRLLRSRTYSPGRRFKPWLYAIATNLVKDHMRSPVGRTVLAAPQMMEIAADEASGPEERAFARLEVARAAAALNELAPEYRATVLLRLFHDFSLQEIADALSIPLGTVKSRLSVGVKQLRQRMEAPAEQ